MSLLEQVFEKYDYFKNREECFASRSPQITGIWDDFITDPTPDKRLEKEWEKIEKNSPIPLPDDYKELFSVFGGGSIEDMREDYLIAPLLSFYLWEDMQDFDDTMEFWEECPKMIPFGDECGDMVYLYGEGNDGLGIYICDHGAIYMEDMEKVATTFTEMFTDEAAAERIKEIFG